MVAPTLMSLVVFGVALLVAVILTPITVRVASRNGWLDRPGFRKVHQSPVPRLGGVAIYVAVWVAWFVFLKLFPNQVPYEFSKVTVMLFVSSTLVWLLGVYDDLKGANAWQKILVQVVASMILLSQDGFGIRIIYTPLRGDIFLNSEPFVWLLTIFWIVFVTNSINLIDGLDGLATGVAFITAMTVYFISKDLGSPHLPFFSLGIAGACLGFLFFNFSPARIFLGDSGSLFLGFLLACLSLLGTTKRSTAIVMYGPPLILALPVADTLFAVLRRFLRKVQLGEIRQPGFRDLMRVLFIRVREVFRADQEHIHHGLLKIGLSHRRAVILLYCVTALLGITAYRTAVYNHLWGTAMTFLVLSGGVFWLRYKSGRKR